MAFQQPQHRPQPVRQLAIPQQHPEISQPLSPGRKRTIEESQEWILFTPQTDGQTASQTSQTPRTATDLGSLETHFRSHQRDDSQFDDDELTGNDTEDDDAAELDSLDDGLHAFHHSFSHSDHLDQSGGAVLPTHDGFGTFPSSSAALQEQLWQFERHNPNRRNKHARRRSSVQRRLEALEEEDDQFDPDDERTARIEQWRLDQSRAVLEEIERETRRRRRRLSRMSGVQGGSERRASMSDALSSRILSAQDSIVHEGSEPAMGSETPPTSESFWRRITRKVIRDLIGLDDTTLAVIFGEELVEEASTTPTQPSPLAAAVQQESRVTFLDAHPRWQIKLLERIARELGILVHQLADFDGTAFNTYKQAQHQPLEYAGLPRHIPRQPSLRQRRRAESASVEPVTADALFSPTVPQTPLSTEQQDTSLWGIEEEPVDDEDEHARQEREYWEKDIDVTMVFSYLKSRFARTAEASAPVPPADFSGPLPASWATGTRASAMSTSPEGLRRAEIIKRQHPLVSRAAERAAERARASTAHSRRRDSLLRRHQMQALMQKRPGSSCASHSTKRSRHTRSGSSRHYWLEGSSVGSGHAMTSGLGGWGEV